MLWKCCTQYASKFGTLSSGYKTGKGQFSFQSQERQCQRMFKLLHNCIHLTLQQSNSLLKILQARLQQYVNTELPDMQAGFRKDRGTRDQVAKICCIIKTARDSRKTSTSALLTMPSVWLCGSQQTVENSSRDGNTRPLYLTPEKSLCRSRSNS